MMLGPNARQCHYCFDFQQFVPNITNRPLLLPHNIHLVVSIWIDALFKKTFSFVASSISDYLKILLPENFLRYKNVAFKHKFSLPHCSLPAGLTPLCRPGIPGRINFVLL